MRNPDAPVAAKARPATPRRRLGAGARRTMLIVHIVSAGSWFGIDVAMAVVIGTVMLTDDPLTAAACLRTLEIITVWPLLSAGLLCLVSGVVLGLGSKWGLVRYWWVAGKLALNLVLTALVLIALRPEVTHLADQARPAMSGVPVSYDLSNLYYPPTVSPTLLLVAFTLSVVKPWGRIRRRRPEPRLGPTVAS
jgi:uncharacterized membrane protein